VTGSGRRRLFFALWPEGETRRRLIAAADTVRETGNGRRVPDENLHITLAFLGSVDESGFDCVRAAAARLSAARFDLDIDRPGWWKRTGILWLGPSKAPAALNRLVKALWAELEPCGFWPDFRDFHPHLTIARRCRRVELVDFEPVPWPVDDVVLLESHTGQKGASYTVIHRWPLTKTA
jgi:2'-5' RNA ligase